MTMPIQKPGKSKQDYSTPNDFIQALEGRFGPMAFDLAADANNTKAEDFYSENDDSLNQDWSMINGNLWLNPPYAKITPWAMKCANSMTAYNRIFLLVPASIGSNWFQDWVVGHACVLALNPRLSFDGKAPYPKDLVLAVYSQRLTGFQPWRWST